MEVAQRLHLQGFSASVIWLHRWKKRRKVGYRRGTNVSQKVPADYQDQLKHFRRAIVRYQELHTYRMNGIGNMVQYVFYICSDIFALPRF